MGRPPLADAYAESPLWWDDGNGPPAPGERPLPAETETLIVGGGYTGVAAARELARRGRRVLIVDRGALGSGASTRNAGFVHPGLKLPVGRLLATRGVLGRELYDETVRAFELVESLVESESIACDYERAGYLVLAAKPAHVGRLRAAARLYLEALDEEARFLSREELADELGSSLFHGGLLLPRAASLHPGKYFGGLVRSAEALGADVCDHAEATAIERDGAEFHVTTSRGRVRAQQVLVATDGYSGPLVPWLQRRIVSIGSYMIATEPLDAATVAAICPRRRTFIDSKNFLHYWKVTADGRLVFGGRTSFAPTTITATRDRLYGAMQSVFPRLAGVRLTHAWGGRVGFTFDLLPHVGRLDGIAFSLGYCGSGVALSTYLGTRTAASLDGEEPPPFARLPFPTAPLYRGSPWFLRFVGWYYGLRDRLPVA